MKSITLQLPEDNTTYASGTTDTDLWVLYNGYDTTGGGGGSNPTGEGRDLYIYYSSMAGDHYTLSRCSRWDVSNYQVVIETWLSKDDAETILTHTKPGAAGELFKIIDKPIYYDKTLGGKNTLMLKPNEDSPSTLKYMRNETLIYPRTITTHPLTYTNNNWIEVKIEGYISGTSNR